MLFYLFFLQTFYIVITLSYYKISKFSMLFGFLWNYHLEYSLELQYKIQLVKI